MKIAKKENYYLICKDDGTNIILSCIEAGLLINYIRKENLRDLIDDQVSYAESDWLDLGKYEHSRNDFIEEIFDAFEDEIDYGNSVSDEQIDEQIADLAVFYGLEKEE